MNIERNTFTGWRVWRIINGRLYSLTNNTEWTPDKAIEAKIEVSFLVVVSTLVSLVFLPLYMVMMVLRHWEWGDIVDMVLVIFILIVWVSTLKSSLLFVWGLLTRTRVQKGSDTPGIYCLNTRDGVTKIAKGYRGDDHILVRGSVDIWGHTIDHKDGAKGEFAFPKEITDVMCSSCASWIPVDEYVHGSNYLRLFHPNCKIYNGGLLKGADSLQILKINAQLWFSH